jgi:hypothetical protein
MKAALLAALASALSGAAGADTPTADLLARAVLSQPRSEVAAPLHLAPSRAKSRYANPLPAGVAKTSVDHRFDDEGTVGSFGFLCGLNPGQRMSGAAGASGYDPMGKFLGAKLSFAFR